MGSDALLPSPDYGFLMGSVFLTHYVISRTVRGLRLDYADAQLV